MILLYEPPDLPPAGWTTVMPIAADVDVLRWIGEQLEAAGHTSRKRSARALDTARGWPLDVETYDVDGQLVVVAVYGFFDLVAAVAIGGLEPAWLLAHELEILAALRAAEVDWGHEPQTLRELWTEAPG